MKKYFNNILFANFFQVNKGEDSFGMNDDDWNVYRDISKEVDSDEENYEIKLTEIEI